MTGTDDAGGTPDLFQGVTEPNSGVESPRFDEELGWQMARDAQRVSAGDLSEAEFHERYHEAVLEEFGRDDRPIESGGET
jgi:hypothetical protein